MQTPKTVSPNVERNRKARRARHARLHPNDKQNPEDARKAALRGESARMREQFKAQGRWKQNEASPAEARKFMQEKKQPV